MAAFFVFYHVAAFLFPILLAIVLAFALYPVSKFFARIPFGPGKMKIPRVIAIILSFFAFAGFLVVIVNLIVFPLFSEVNKLLANLPNYAQRVDASNIGAVLIDPQTRAELPSNILALVDSSLAWAMSYLMGTVKSLAESTFTIAASLIGLMIVPFLAFYFLKDWQELRQMGINVFVPTARPLASTIVDEMGRVMSAYVRGMAQLSVIVGISITLGTFALGVEFPLVLGFIALIAETIPVVGPLMGAVPAAFIAYSESPLLAFKVAVFYLVFYQFDSNFLLPKIMGKSIALHPVILIISLLIGAKLFGIVGLLFAVPVAAVCKVLYKHLWHLRETKLLP
ncbi:MAG: AI-2E family transporter [Acidaminococcaceae bacterium]